jgi:hypothetical protein
MKNVIVAGLVAMTTVLGVAGQAQALPETVLCAVGSELRGGERSPMVGLRCELEMIEGVIKARANDMTFIWSDRGVEGESTTMGISQSGGNVILLQNAYANTSENGLTHCAIGDMVGSRTTTVVSVCVTRSATAANN